MEVHRHLGPGLLESAYDACLAYELSSRGIRFERQVRVPVIYKGVELECGYRLDFVVENELIVEVKAVEALLPVHHAQVITYMRLTGLSVGLLVNFHADALHRGLRRLACTRKPFPASRLPVASPLKP
jgi:GxxExxY protein